MVYIPAPEGGIISNLFLKVDVLMIRLTIGVYPFLLFLENYFQEDI